MKTPSPRSISRNRIGGLFQYLIRLLPTEEAGTQRRSRDDLESGLFVSRYPQDACYLLVRHPSGGLTNLASEVIIWSLHGGSAK